MTLANILLSNSGSLFSVHWQFVLSVCAAQLNSQWLHRHWKKKVSILGCWLENTSGSRQQRKLLTGQRQHFHCGSRVLS